MTTQREPDTSAEERGWLCERQDGGSPAWWTPLGDDGGEWVSDASKALRFAREVDAEAYIEEAGWTDVIPTEHIWYGN